MVSLISTGVESRHLTGAEIMLQIMDSRYVRKQLRNSMLQRVIRSSKGHETLSVISGFLINYACSQNELNVTDACMFYHYKDSMDSSV